MTDTTDQALVARVLKGMSDQISQPYRNTTAPEPAPVDVPSFAVNEPMAPMAPEDLQRQMAADDDPVNQRQARQSASSSSHSWGGHQNGRIPASLMTEVASGHRLESSAAEQWSAMREAAAADGVNLSLTDSYRSYDAQVAVRRDKGHVVATATPGTSVHGWGRAVDANVNDPETLAWLRENAGRFGWVNPAWAQREGKSYEPWHWEFTGGEA